MGSNNSKTKRKIRRPREYLSQRNWQADRYPVKSFLTIDESSLISLSGSDSTPLSKPGRKSHAFHDSSPSPESLTQTSCSNGNLQSLGDDLKENCGVEIEFNFEPMKQTKGCWGLTTDLSGDGFSENDSCNNLFIDEQSFYGDDDTSEGVLSETMSKGQKTDLFSKDKSEVDITSNEEQSPQTEKQSAISCQAKSYNVNKTKKMYDLGPLKQDQDTGSIKKELHKQGIITNESMMMSASGEIKRDLKQKGIITESCENYRYLSRVRLPPMKFHTEPNKDKLKFVNKRFDFCENFHTTVLKSNNTTESKTGLVQPDAPPDPDKVISKVLDIDLV